MQARTSMRARSGTLMEARARQRANETEREDSGVCRLAEVAGQTLWASFSKKHKKIGDTVSKWLIL